MIMKYFEVHVWCHASAHVCSSSELTKIIGLTRHLVFVGAFGECRLQVPDVVDLCVSALQVRRKCAWSVPRSV